MVKGVDDPFDCFDPFDLFDPFDCFLCPSSRHRNDSR